MCPQVGDNTFPNVFALMTGRTHTEARWTSRKYIDTQGFRFLWQDFADEGYRTWYAEDDPGINTFNFAQIGFQDQPFHYYGRPMEMAKQEHARFTDNKNCLGGIPNLQILQDHLAEFSRLFRDKPHFGFLWYNRLTHGNLNAGSQVTYVSFACLFSTTASGV